MPFDATEDGDGHGPRREKSLTVYCCSFHGVGLDGSDPFPSAQGTGADMMRLVGWVCIGPTDSSPVPWRVRLARWLLAREFGELRAEYVSDELPDA